ncbi:MAG TPA: efflux RND transporter periplasmic adaptor subunit [Burkholderiales bacterium]|jgi:multidrug efflux system membrane fusion protein|nr:efflux RND transporter periplasmic adaptor subunit [Burkholderiales bacterium]
MTPAHTRAISPTLPARRLLLAAALACLAACGKAPEKPPEPRLVNVVRVDPGTGTGEVAYSGDVRARYETNLSFRVSGKIVARNVEVGTVVRAGEVLARLDPEDQKLNAQSAQSQLAAAKSEFEQLKADLERYTDLYRKEFISKAEYDRHLSNFNVAQARLEQARAQLSVTQNQTGYTTLTADHAGVVTAIQAEVGQVVAAGQTVVKLARTDDKEVVISIPENRLAELNASKDIGVTLWANPEARYRGKVREVSPSADPVTRTYAAKITVLNADAAMKLGMTANVYLKGVRREAAAMLPATALFQDNGKAAVWVVDLASNTVKLVPVEVGEYVEDRVAVTSGLKKGDVVVRAGVHKLFEGEKVRLAEPAQPAREAAK